MGESTRRRALGVLLLAGVLAACGGGGGDGGDDSGDRGGETTTTAAEDDPAATATTIGGGASTRSEEAQAYVDALVEASATSGVSRSPDENRCFSEAYVDTMGADVLAEAMPADEVAESPGLAPDEIGVVMTPEQEDAFYANLQRCLDVKRFFVTAFTTGVEMSETEVTCLSGALDDSALKVMVLAPFDGDTAPIESDQGFVDLIARLTAACPSAMEAAGWT
jgi:hypothetical protein